MKKKKNDYGNKRDGSFKWHLVWQKSKLYLNYDFVLSFFEIYIAKKKCARYYVVCVCYSVWPFVFPLSLQKKNVTSSSSYFVEKMKTNR